MREESLSPMDVVGERRATPLGKSVVANEYKMGLRYSRCFYFTKRKCSRDVIRIVKTRNSAIGPVPALGLHVE